MNYAEAINLDNRKWHDIIIGRPSIPYGILFFLMIWARIRLDVYFDIYLIKYLSVYLLGLLFLVWLATPLKKLDNKQLHYILLFGVLMAIAVPLARHAWLAFAATKAFLFYVVIGSLVQIQFIDTFRKWERYLRWSVMLIALVAIQGIFTGGWVEGIPALGDENDFCLFMNTMIPLAFFLGQASRTISRKILFYGCMALFLIAVLMTFSRGGFLGLLTVGLFMVLKNPRRLAGFFLIGLLALAVFVTAPSEYWREMETIKTENIEVGTGKNRIEYWKAGLKIFKDNPLLGVGPKNYGVWLPEYHTSDQHKRWGRVAHSVYIDVLAEMGMAGMILFLALIWRNYQDYRYISRLEQNKAALLREAAIKDEEKERISESIRMLYFISLGYFGSLIAYLVTGIFISVLFYSNFWSITVGLVITANIARKMEGALTAAAPASRA